MSLGCVETFVSQKQTTFHRILGSLKRAWPFCVTRIRRSFWNVLKASFLCSMIVCVIVFEIRPYECIQIWTENTSIPFTCSSEGIEMKHGSSSRPLKFCFRIWSRKNCVDLEFGWILLGHFGRKNTTLKPASKTSKCLSIKTIFYRYAHCDCKSQNLRELQNQAFVYYLLWWICEFDIDCWFVILYKSCIFQAGQAARC